MTKMDLLSMSSSAVNTTVLEANEPELNKSPYYLFIMLLLLSADCCLFSLGSMVVVSAEKFTHLVHSEI